MRALNRLIYIVAAFSLFACGRTGKEALGVDGMLTQSLELNEVEVITLAPVDFPRQLISNGKLNAASRASLSFGCNGTISSINARNGQYVSAGTTIATIESRNLDLALESAAIAMEKAEYDLYDFLVGQGYAARDTVNIPDEVLATAKMKSGYNSARNGLRRARHDKEGTVLKAPFRGRIADISMGEHEQSEGLPFCTLIDDSSFFVGFTVLESDYSFLSVDLPVRVIPYADENLSFNGKISDINPTIDGHGQVFVRARVNGNSKLVDGMNVKVIVERVVPDQMVVPRSAVVIRDNLDIVFTYTDDGKAHWTYVKILMSNGESHVIQADEGRNSFLGFGDKVIVSGNLNLADGSTVALKK